MANSNKIKLNVEVQSIFKTETSKLDSTISGLEKTLNSMGSNPKAKKSVQELKKGYEDIKKTIESSGVIGGDTKSDAFFKKAEGASAGVDKALKMASIIIEKINTEISEMKKNIKSFSAETEKLEKLKLKKPVNRVEASSEETRLREMNAALNKNQFFDSKKRKINVGDAAVSSGVTKDYDYSNVQSGDKMAYKADPIYLALDQIAATLKSKSNELESGISDIKKTPSGSRTISQNTKLKSLQSEFKIQKQQRNEIIAKRKEIREIYDIGVKDLDNTKEYDSYAEKISAIETKIKNTGIEDLNTAESDLVQKKLALKYAEEQEKSSKAITSSNLSRTASSKKYTREVTKQNSGLKASKSLISDLVVKQITMQKVIQGVQRIWSEVIQTIGQLDKSLTDITVVTSMNRETVYGLLGDYQNLAKTVGLTTTEVVDLSTQFYRQGKTTEEAFKLTETAAKLARIASIDATDAADYLTSALNGFGLSAGKAVDVTDKLANLSANSASSVEELAVALQKVAPSAATAGVNIDNMMGFLAKGIETTREAPENIGTAFKTIFARMSQLSDLGSTTEDGMSLSTVDKALSDVGITLRDTINGGFRPLDEVLIDLGNSWSELDSYEKAYVGTALAGTRQQSRLQAVMNDFPRTLELIEQSQESSGIAALQHTEYMKGLEASITNLKTTWQTFVTSITDADLIVNIIQALTSAFSGLVTVLDSGLGKIGAIMIAIKLGKTTMGNISAKLSEFSDAFKNIEKDSAKFDSLKRVEKSLGKWKASLEGSSTSLKGLLSVFKKSSAQMEIEAEQAKKLAAMSAEQLAQEKLRTKELKIQKGIKLLTLAIVVTTLAIFKKISDSQPETKELAQWKLALESIVSSLKIALDFTTDIINKVADFLSLLGQAPAILIGISTAIGILIATILLLKAAIAPVLAVVSVGVSALGLAILAIVKLAQGASKKAEAAIMSTTNAVETLNEAISDTSDLLSKASDKWETYNKLKDKAYLTDAEKTDFSEAEEYFNTLAASGDIENNWEVNTITIESYLDGIQAELEKNEAARSAQLESLFGDSDFQSLTPEEIINQIKKDDDLDSSEQSSMITTAKVARTSEYMQDSGASQTLANSFWDYNSKEGGELNSDTMRLLTYSLGEIEDMAADLLSQDYSTEDITNSIANKISEQLNSKELSDTNKEILAAIYKGYNDDTRTAVVVKELAEQYGDNNSDSYTLIQRGMMAQGQQAIQDWLDSQSSLTDEEKASLKDKYISNLMQSVAGSSRQTSVSSGLLDSGTSFGDKQYATAINSNRKDVSMADTIASLKEFGDQYEDMSEIIENEDYSIDAVEKMQGYLEDSPELLSDWMNGTLKASDVIKAKYEEMEQSIEDTIQAQVSQGASEETLESLERMRVLTKELGIEEMKRADANIEINAFYEKTTKAIQDQIDALDEEATSLEQIGKIQALNEKARSLSKLDLSTSIDSQAAKKQMAAEVNDLQKQMEIDIKKINLEAQQAILEKNRDESLIKSQADLKLSNDKLRESIDKAYVVNNFSDNSGEGSVISNS